MLVKVVVRTVEMLGNVDMSSVKYVCAVVINSNI